ncbi:Uncharacterized protein DBV15_10166 [Temnothorax longispinosus]|uniref:Uncharacterized protein n=1 Tax=Temnothorax longispinosus TaxID=300112 RepID=A0A4S2JQK3_9HYME|nr:Uncharacterized protein DBV15_10166 [Temnothorax longispinosus]
MNISNMKFFFVISTFALIAICRGADESLDESKLLTKLTPIIGSQPVYSDNTHNQKDLIASASDRTFHITKGYPGSIGGYPGSIGGYPGSIGGYPGSIGGYSGGYAGGYPGGYGTGIIGSVYPGTSYRGSNLIPGGDMVTQETIRDILALADMGDMEDMEDLGDMVVMEEDILVVMVVTVVMVGADTGDMGDMGDMGVLRASEVTTMVL